MGNDSYVGPERRKEVEPGRLGRRNYDWHCGEHALIQSTTKDHRTMVCGKIAAVQKDIKKSVSWVVFTFFAGFAIIILGSGFGYFATQIEKNADRQAMAMIKITSTLEEIQQSQAVMKHQIGAIKERQDVLRDIQQGKTRQE